LEGTYLLCEETKISKGDSGADTENGGNETPPSSDTGRFVNKLKKKKTDPAPSDSSADTSGESSKDSKIEYKTFEYDNPVKCSPCGLKSKKP